MALFVKEKIYISINANLVKYKQKHGHLYKKHICAHWKVLEYQPNLTLTTPLQGVKKSKMGKKIPEKSRKLVLYILVPQ